MGSIVRRRQFMSIIFKRIFFKLINLITKFGVKVKRQFFNKLKYKKM